MGTKIKIKGAIFDMDGTLIHSLFFWERFWQSIGKRYFNDDHFQVDVALEKKLRTSIYPNSLRIVAEKYHITDEHFFDDYLQFLSDFYRYEISAKSGAAELLSFLKEQGIPTCVASASNLGDLDVALRACGLREYIDSLHSCAEVGVGKERPDIFFKATESMGVDVCDVCVFEDSFLALETAKAAGLMFICSASSLVFSISPSL